MVYAFDAIFLTALVAVHDLDGEVRVEKVVTFEPLWNPVFIQVNDLHRRVLVDFHRPLLDTVGRVFDEGQWMHAAHDDGHDELSVRLDLLGKLLHLALGHAFGDLDLRPLVPGPVDLEHGLAVDVEVLQEVADGAHVIGVSHLVVQPAGEERTQTRRLGCSRLRQPVSRGVNLDPARVEVTVVSGLVHDGTSGGRHGNRDVVRDAVHLPAKLVQLLRQRSLPAPRVLIGLYAQLAGRPDLSVGGRGVHVLCHYRIIPMCVISSGP